jgi:hypothetical protein
MIIRVQVPLDSDFPRLHGEPKLSVPWAAPEVIKLEATVARGESTCKIAVDKTDGMLLLDNASERCIDEIVQSHNVPHAMYTKCPVIV